MEERLRSFLKDCTIKNGEIHLKTSLSKDDLVALCDGLRDDILLGKVPHAKVIGAKICTGAGIAISDFISKRSDVNKSYAELYTTFDELVFEDIDGNPFQGFESANLESWGYVSTCKNDVTSEDGMYYVGKGLSNKPRCLIKGIDIIKFSSVGSVLNMIVAKGTGDKNFTEISSLVKGCDYVPFGQYYNLSQYLTVRRMFDGDKVIKLMYKRDIDEEVLTSIIRNYADYEM